jgi:hypothetical protein
MKLTGKCKEDFDKWYFIEFEKRSLPYIFIFYAYDLSVQHGVYVDFFDSVKYKGNSFLSTIFARYYKDKTEHFTHNDIIRNSIEAANKIYNKIIEK